MFANCGVIDGGNCFVGHWLTFSSGGSVWLAPYNPCVSP